MDPRNSTKSSQLSSKFLVDWRGSIGIDDDNIHDSFWNKLCSYCVSENSPVFVTKKWEKKITQIWNSIFFCKFSNFCSTYNGQFQKFCSPRNGCHGRIFASFLFVKMDDSTSATEWVKSDFDGSNFSGGSYVDCDVLCRSRLHLLGLKPSKQLELEHVPDRFTPLKWESRKCSREKIQYLSMPCKLENTEYPRESDKNWEKLSKIIS